MNTVNKWLFAVVVIGSISSCLPPYPTSDELYDDEFVIVNRDTLIDFSSYKTYSVPDTIYYLDKDSVLTAFETDYSDQIIDAINTNMQSRGYVEVERDQNPDLAVMITILNSTTIVYYPGSWWGYWDCYYWYYYCGGWYYPSYPTVSSYTAGSLIIELADLKNGGSEDNPAIALNWNALIYTLTEDNPQLNVNQGIKGVNKAFEISTYISAN